MRKFFLCKLLDVLSGPVLGRFYVVGRLYQRVGAWACRHA